MQKHAQAKAKSIENKGQKMTANYKLNKWGNSLAVRIPIKMAQKLNLNENSTLNIFTQNDKIIIQKRLSLEEKCQLITAKNRHIDTKWSDESVGNEW